MTKRKFALLLILAAVAGAQEAAPGFGQRMKQNAEDLKQYSYKRRMQIMVKDRSTTRVDLIRYVDGKMETVPLETPQRGDGQAGGRGLRGRRMGKKLEKKKEEMKEEVEELTSLLQRYSPGSDSMHSALEKATISRAGSGPNADVKVEAKGIIESNDSFSLVWSVANRRPTNIDIHASLNGKPVRVAIDYASLPDGPFYAAHTVVSAPGKDLTVNIDTFDYMRSAVAQ